MTFTVDRVDLIPDDHESRSRPLSQRGGDVLVIAHHSVSRTLGAILSTFKSKDRTVTANYAIGPDVAGVDDYKTVLTVRENEDRAYTTSSSKDDIAITFEMADLQLAPPWPVGNTGLEILVELIIHAHEAYGMPVDRYHVTCHREVYERGWGSYATACPGDHLHGSLDWAVDEANRRIAGGGKKTKGDIMARYQWAAGRGGVLVKGELGGIYTPASIEEAEVLSALYDGIDISNRQWDVSRQASLNIQASRGDEQGSFNKALDAAMTKIYDKLDNLDGAGDVVIDEKELAKEIAAALAEEGIEAKVDAEALADVVLNGAAARLSQRVEVPQ